MTGKDSEWPILIISLKDAMKRRAAISSDMKTLGLDFKFIDAVDGRTALPEEYETLIDRISPISKRGRHLSDAEYACALSHQKIYKLILDHCLPGAIVLEDDAILNPGFVSFITKKSYLSRHLILLDHTGVRKWPWVKPQRLPCDHCSMRLAKNAHLTTGYSISRVGAQYLRNHSFPIAATADWPCDTVPLKPVAVIPRLIDHPEPGVEMSYIDLSRTKLRTTSRSRHMRRGRFFTSLYWRDWLRKRLTVGVASKNQVATALRLTDRKHADEV